MDVYCILIKVGWLSSVMCLLIVLTLFQLLLRHSLCNKLRSISARRRLRRICRPVGYKSFFGFCSQLCDSWNAKCSYSIVRREIY